MRKFLSAALLLLLPFLAALPVWAATSPKDSLEKRVYAVSKDLDALTSLLQEYRKEKDSTAVGITLYHIGRYYNQESEYIKSISAYRGALAAHNETTDAFEIVRTIIGLATSDRRIGAYSDAAANLYHGLEVLEGSDYVDTEQGQRHHSYLYNGLGNVYKYLDNGEDAELYFRLSLRYDQMIRNYTGMAMNWSTLGSIYEYRNQLDSAAIMYQRALTLNQRGRSTSGVGITLNRIGQLSRELGDNKKAEQEFLAAYDSLTKARDRWNLAKSTMSLAAIYIENGDIKNAQRFIDESNDLIKGRHSYGHEQELHSLKAMLHAKKGNYKDAYDESLIAIAYKDSSAAQKDDQEIAQSRINFIESENDRELERIRSEKDHESFLKKEILWGGIIAVSVLLLVLLLAFRYLLIQRKLNRSLEETNELKNKFFSIISHDLKNPLIAQDNSLKIIENLIDYAPREVVKKQIGELRKSSDSTLRLLKNLLDWSRLQAGKMSYEPIRIDLHDVCVDAIELLKEQIEQKDISVKLNIPHETYALCDLNMIRTAMRNLISNAIKYSYKKGSVEIDCKDAEVGRICISVTDHGVGMTKEKTDQILHGDVLKSSVGTSGEEGTGLGLLICREFVDLAGGKREIISEPGKGSKFSFTVLKDN